MADTKMALSECMTSISKKRHMFIGLAGVCILVLAVLVIAGCSNGASDGGSSSTPSDAGTSAGDVTIDEKDLAFSPANATVSTGDTVTFTNSDSVPHNVEIDGEELGLQQPGESVTWTAPEDGSYPYLCTIHPSMTGQITVGSNGASAPPAGGGGY